MRIGGPRAWRPTPWLVTGLVAIFLAGGLPLIWLAIVALGDPSALGATLVSARALALLEHTLLLGVCVAAVAGMIGTALGLLIGKTDVPFRVALAAVLTFPLCLPPYVVALGWFTVLGRHGLLAAALGASAGIGASTFFFGVGGAVLVLTTAYTPITMLLVLAALRSVDPAVEEAARVRFGWRVVVCRIDLPLITPAVVLGALVTFILVVGEFGVAAYLRVPVFSAAVFTQFAAFLDIRTAVALSVPLTGLVVAALTVERYVLRERIRFLARSRAGNRLVAPLGRAAMPIGAVSWTYAIVTVIAPVAGLAVHAGGAASYVTAIRGASSSAMRSIWTAGAAATLALTVGLLLAYVVEWTGDRRRDGLDTLSLLLFATPGTVLGVALIALWNRNGLPPIYGTVAIVLVGYVAHYVPIAGRVIGIGLRGISRGTEDAARLAGVPWTAALRRTLVPVIAPALAGAWLLTFILCFRDLDLVMTIYPPGAETLPIRVYTLMANSSEAVTAALAMMLIGVTVLMLVLIAGAFVTMRRRVAAWL